MTQSPWKSQSHLWEALRRDPECPPCLERLLLVAEKCANHSLRQLAKDLGLSPAAIYNMMGRRQPVSKIQALAIEGKYKVRHQWMLHGDGRMFLHIEANEMSHGL